jgi:hypothetical protein
MSKDFIQARTHAIEARAQAKIVELNRLLDVCERAQADLQNTPRNGALLIPFLEMHADLCEQKAAALRTIEDVCVLRREFKELAAA